LEKKKLPSLPVMIIAVTFIHKAADYDEVVVVAYGTKKKTDLTVQWTTVKRSRYRKQTFYIC
jgi:hypothetical protein